jgi:hypothetical protein
MNRSRDSARLSWSDSSQSPRNCSSSASSIASPVSKHMENVAPCVPGGLASSASSCAIRRSANLLLERAACSLSSRVRLSVVSWRTRCLRVVFSVVIRAMAFLSPLGFQVADLAEELADAGALGEDLGVGGLEGVLGVQCPLPPGRLRSSAWAASSWTRCSRPRRALSRLRPWRPGCCRGRCGRRPPGGRRRRR